jgi:hypothetical protein
MPEWVNLLINWLSLPSLAVLAVVLLYRRWHKEFPLFFAYVVVTQVVGLTRLFTFRTSVDIYRDVYFVSDIVLAVFAFLATYELFIKRLFPGSYRIGFFRYLFPMAVVAIAVVASFTAFHGDHKSVLLVTARVYEFCRAAVLMFFVALMVFMGRQWSRQEFGIALGFALDVSTSLALIAFWSRAQRTDPVLSRVPVIAYDIACILWLYCFWSQKPSVTPSSPTLPPEALHEAKKWEESLKDFITPGKR